MDGEGDPGPGGAPCGTEPGESHEERGAMARPMDVSDARQGRRPRSPGTGHGATTRRAQPRP
eukprot:11166215-Lingulodinium_polyedra.AAC.1